jgi:DNA-binding HxlR family transcriptional regulator
MPTPDFDQIAHIDRALVRLSPRWVSWILQTLQQHGPMRPGQLAEALPWAGIWPIQHRLAHMLDDGLVHRHRYGLYQPSAAAQALPPLHRALATWHRDHLAPHTGEPLADAERTEIALTCLAFRGSTATLHTLHGTEAMTHGELRRNAGLPAGSASSRFQRLHTDGLLHRSGPPDNPRYALTDAARALTPLSRTVSFGPGRTGSVGPG